MLLVIVRMILQREPRTSRLRFVHLFYYLHLHNFELTSLFLLNGIDLYIWSYHFYYVASLVVPTLLGVIIFSSVSHRSS